MKLTEFGLPDEAANTINKWMETLEPSECWQKVSNTYLNPKQNFKLHEFLYQEIYKNSGPAYIPTESFIKTTNLAKMMQAFKIESYWKCHTWSTKNCDDFWNYIVQTLEIKFKTPFTAISDLSEGVEQPKWFPASTLNIADSCFNAPATAPAIIYQDNTDIKSVSFDELNKLSNQVANGIKNLGFKPKDAIAIDMLMTVEAVAIYLGIIKAGCAVVSIADSFAPDEIATRLKISNAKGIFTQDYLARNGKKLPLYEKVVDAKAPKAIVLPSNENVSMDLREGDIVWDDFLDANTEFESVACSPEDAINILFSSGTTGDPKAIPWTQTTPIKCASDAHLHHNIKPGEVLAWPTNLGWMMGPWLIFAALLNKASVALFYGAPTTKEFCEFVQDAKVNMLGLVPSIVKVWRKTNCIKDLDWSCINEFSSTGECSNPSDMLYLMSRANYKPVIEYCGGTEIGGGYITSTVIQPNAPATFTTPALGLDFTLLDEDGNKTNNGEVAIIPPSIGLSTELLNKDHHKVYYQDMPLLHGKVLRRHGDQVEQMELGLYRALGRVDDTMNLGGIKISSAEIERTLSELKTVTETAAIAVNPSDGGPSQLVIYTVTNQDTDKNTLKSEMQTMIKSKLNPLFKIHDVVFVDSLPRTASNKVMRRVLRDQYS